MARRVKRNPAQARLEEEKRAAMLAALDELEAAIRRRRGLLE